MNALLIFAKWPEPGKVKTRLSPPFSGQEAADLYHCMLMDTLESTEALPGILRMICFDGEPERAANFRVLAPDAEVLMQEGSDLGERLLNAFEKGFSRGFSNVAVIGTDSPHMPTERITEAFELLDDERSDVVFGPSEDGGYYLIALKKPQPELLKDIPWSSSDTLARTLEKTALMSLQARLLARCFDLDTAEDLVRLQELPHAAAPRTVAYISRLIPI